MNSETDHYLKNELYELIKSDEGIFDFIQESSLDGLWFCDLEKTENKWINPKFWKVLGYNPDEMQQITNAWRSIINHDGLKSAAEDFGNPCENPDHPYNRIVRFTHQDGSLVWMRFRGLIIRDKEGKPYRLLGTYHNITEFKNAETGLEKEKEKAEESEARYRRLLTNLEVGVVVHAPDTSIVLSNPRASELLGLTEAKMKGKVALDTQWKFVDKDGEPLPIGEYPVMQILNSKKSVKNQVYGVYRAENDLVWLTVNGFPVTNENGEIQEIIISFIDITERKLAEDAQAEVSQRLRLANKATNDVIWDWDVLNDTRQWNQAGTKVFGWTEIVEQPVGAHWWVERVHPDDRDRIHATFFAVVDNPKLDTWNDEYRFLKADGTYSYVMDRGYVLRDKQGKAIRMIGAMLDITERKRSEELLRLNRNMLDQILNSIPQSVFWKDRESRYLGCNTAFVRATGLENSSDIIGKTDFDLPWPQEEAEAYRADDRFVMENNQYKYHIIEPLQQADGSRLWIDTTKIPLTDGQGNVYGVLGVYEDITTRKFNEEQLQQAKEKAEESDRLKTAFLQNMSHEIRTPMNAIMGFSSLLPKSFNNRDKLETFSRIIEMRCTDLLDIINDILDISKIESGQSTISIEHCNINELFDELGLFFKDYMVRLHKQDIKLIFLPAPENTLYQVKTDKLKLKQVIMNLVSNAIKFTERGSVTCGFMQKNNKLEFYVRDTGIAIPKDKFEFIFERFSQLKQPSGQNIGGTGLGLPIVKGLVELLGGTVWLESEGDKGKTFYFTIDCIEADSVNAKIIDAEDGQGINTDKTILIVEDDVYNAAYLKEVLGNFSSNIISVSNGLGAVTIAKKQKVDLILMDIRLPDISGYEAIRQILQHNPGIKIIAQTAYAENAENKKAMDAGCVDYISKPIKQEQLISMMNKYLQ